MVVLRSRLSDFVEVLVDHIVQGCVVVTHLHERDPEEKLIDNFIASRYSLVTQA